MISAIVQNWISPGCVVDSVDRAVPFYLPVILSESDYNPTEKN